MVENAARAIRNRAEQPIDMAEARYLARAALDAPGIGEMVEALEPFAEKADYADALEASDDDYVDCAPFKAGDYRRARAIASQARRPHDERRY
jgi:hypothetical protein